MIQCEGLTKIYRQGERSIYAVKDCNLKINDGDFTAIIGASGSGKSTLLHLLSAFDRPTNGRVLLDGEDLFALNEKNLAEIHNQKIGFVFQSFHLLPILTAKENILMPALIRGERISEIYFQELIDVLGLASYMDHLPDELSGGQRQRTAVARALINKPSILFADEPTGNLDAESAQELIGLLVEMRRLYGQTIVMVTHDMNLVGFADKRYRMDNGIISLT